MHLFSKGYSLISIWISIDLAIGQMIPLMYSYSPLTYHYPTAQPLFYPFNIPRQYSIYTNPAKIIPSSSQFLMPVKNKAIIPSISYRNGAGFSRTPYMVRTPCAKSLSIVYDLYQDFDLNKDSSVSKSEFSIGVRQMKSRLGTKLQWIKFMTVRTDDVDLDKNGIIGIDEFEKWYSMFIDRILFKYYDSNGDGYIDGKEYNQEFEDRNIQPLFGIEEFDIRGMMKGSNRIGQPDGKLDYDEFQNSIRKIPGIYEKFPGMSQFMSDFVDMFCNGTN